MKGIVEPIKKIMHLKQGMMIHFKKLRASVPPPLALRPSPFTLFPFVRLGDFFFSPRCLIFALCLFALAPLLLPLPVKAQLKHTIYFFNPETNINNFASLKIEFDTYLSKLGEYQLQPFNDREIFEKSVYGKKDGIFLVSSWHYKNLKEKFPLKAVLVGVFNGKSTQKRVLSVRKDIGNTDLRGLKVASAGNKEYTLNILKEILGGQGEEVLSAIQIMPVPKDIDALMAVGFGMAAAALTSENSLLNLEKINPKHHQQLKQLGKSGEMFLAIVAAPVDAEPENKPLLEALARMGGASEGESKLRMLGLEGFRALSASETEALKK